MQKKRPIMGKIAVENADYVIVTDDNPRWEEPKKIVEDILEGMNQTVIPAQAGIQSLRENFYDIANPNVILAQGRIVANVNNPNNSDFYQNDNSLDSGFRQNDISSEYSTVRIIHDRKKAIEHAIWQAKVEDWVVIAGKGHENYQQIKDEKIPQSDYEIASGVLEQAYNTGVLPVKMGIHENVILAQARIVANINSPNDSDFHQNDTHNSLDSRFREDKKSGSTSNSVFSRPAGEEVFTGITIDSRAVKPGYLFIACPSENRNADNTAQHIKQAIQNGARAIITSYPK